MGPAGAELGAAEVERQSLQLLKARCWSLVSGERRGQLKSLSAAVRLCSALGAGRTVKVLW